MREICQNTPPVRPWAEPDLNRLPGMRPIPTNEWLVQDECFAAQMAYRDHLVTTRRGAVIGGHSEAAIEARDLIIATLERAPDYDAGAGYVTRPDGVTVTLDDTPIATIARLIQEDICILEKRDAEHVLTSAALCFPASWTLAEKLHRPLMAIHTPVDAYGTDIGKRVQRMFNALRPDRILMRANYLGYADADLHQPRPEDAVRMDTAFNFLRMERQTLRRLPQSGAVLFAIHTYVIPAATLSAADRHAVERADHK